MQAKALLLSIAVAGALNVNLSAAEQPGVPHGWSATPAVGKQYEVGYDNQAGATYVRSVDEPGTTMGGLMQAIDAQPFVGQDVQLKAEVKVEGNPERAELYLRASAGERQNSGASWNSPKEWQEVSVQLGSGVDKTVQSLDFGILLKGKGRVWVRNVRIASLAPKARVSNNAPLHNQLPVPTLASRAVNLELRP